MEAVSMFAPEVEALVQQLKPFPLKEVGSASWFKQRDYVEQLNIQAHNNAIKQEEEIVKEALITFDKFPILIHELLVIEIWKQQILPLLKKDIIQQCGTTSMIKPYFLIYYESTLVNLLEITMYHKESCLSAGETLVEIVDYCLRKLLWIHSGKYKQSFETDSNKSLKEEPSIDKQLDEKQSSNEFLISMGALNLLRIVCDYVSVLPVSVLKRLLITHDAISSLVEVMLVKPWLRKTSGKQLRFTDNRWEEIPNGKYQRITKTEAQVWIALYNLILDIECRKRYEFTEQSKNTILKLKTMITEPLIDQLPILADLRTFLEQLTVQEPPRPSNIPFLVEQLPEIRDKLLNENFKEIATYQKETILPQLNKNDEMERLAKMFQMTNWDEHLGKPKCGSCGKLASKKCSKCKNEWYCGRECQVKAWNQHKSICTILSQDIQKREEQQMSSQATNDAINFNNAHFEVD